jgi:hypothetical protein
MIKQGAVRGYWSDLYRNQDGKSLQYCLDNYGYGIRKDLFRDMEVFVVFLSSNKTFKRSWLVRVNRISTGIFAVVTFHRNAAMTYIKKITLPSRHDIAAAQQCI